MLRTVVSTKTLMPFDFLVKNYIDLTHLMAPFLAVAKIKTFEILFLLCLDTLNLPIPTFFLKFSLLLVCNWKNLKYIHDKKDAMIHS